jgi:hypothetical protein
MLNYLYFSHPYTVCMTYSEHCNFSLKLARYFFSASCKAFIHAFIPNLFITSSSDTIENVKLLLETSGCRKEHND